MRHKLLRFLSVLVAGLGTAQVAANDIEPTKEKYTASFTLTPIVLDGKLNEWAGAGVIADPKFAVPKGSGAKGKYVLFEEYSGGTWTGPDDQTSAVQVVYDVDNVYFGIVVTDDYHENAANSAWNGDSVQLMIANGTRSGQVALYNYALGGVEGATGDVIVMHEAGPGGTEAVITRDAATKKTYYEIKLPAASLGLKTLTPGTKFGLGMAINDGDELTPGQKGWGGLGAHSIVFGKTPSETALVTLGSDKPTIEILGVGTEALLGGDLTDPENDGNEDAGSADSSWNWKAITSSVEPGFGGGEFSFNIFDNKVGGGNDKWCCDDPTEAKPVWVAVEFANPVSLTHFTLASGNDTPGRDATKFQIQGSNDGTSYTPIFVHDNSTPLWTDVRNQVIKVTLPIPSVLFRYIRYYATETPATLHQIGEIEYFGTYGGTALAYFSGINPTVTGFSFRTTDAGTSVVDPATFKLRIDGVLITIPVPTKTAGVVDVAFKPTQQFLPGTSHTYSITAKDGVGNNITAEGTWKTPAYALLTAADKVAADTSKPGFMWNVHQNASFGENNNVRPLNQLAGLLGENFANPDATGVALKAGTPGANNKLPIRFEIETVINMDQAGGSNGTIQPDDQMPGIPGTTEGTDGIAGEIITYLELPAGKHTLIVNSDDGFKTSAGNFLDVFQAQVAGEFSGGRGASDTAYDIYVAEAGIYPFRTVWQEGGGGANIEWLSVQADGTKVLLNDRANGGFKAYRATTTGAPTAVTSVTPAVGDTAVNPSSGVQVVISEGTSAVDSASIKINLDGSDVAATVTKVGNLITASYKPASAFAPNTSHTVKLSFKSGANTRNETWSFKIPKLTTDKVKGIVGFLTGVSAFTADKGGRSGAAGDYGLDLTASGSSVLVGEGSFLTAAAADDTMTIALWLKHYNVSDSSAFWANSPSSNNGTRGFQAHLPWGNNNIYFDTAGCCNADDQRISADIATFPGYPDPDDRTWWNVWRHFALVKNGATKQIYIDGVLFLEGGGTSPLPLDFTSLVIGGGPLATDNLTHGIIDDFTVYNGGLSAADVKKLASGGAPSTVSGLAAHWDFNDGAPAAIVPSLKIARDAASIKVTFTGALQSSTSVTGPFTDLAGTSPLTIAPTDSTRFYRIKP